MGFFDDFLGVAKDVVRGSSNAVKDAADFLVDQDAWSNTARAVMDGPGGREVRPADLLSMALDSSMLIPGAGLAGGGARLAAKAAAKNAAKESAEAIARKETVRSLRSPLNNAVRDKVGGVSRDAVSRTLGSGAGRHAAGGATNTARATQAGARRAAKDPLKTQMGRMAAKQKAGVGRKVGFGQTKRRTLGNALLTGGANALVGTYDRFDDRRPNVEEVPRDDNTPPLFPGMMPGGTYSILLGGGGGGGGQLTPESFMAALAEFMDQNGRVGGQQVIHAD